MIVTSYNQYLEHLSTQIIKLYQIFSQELLTTEANSERLGGSDELNILVLP